VAPSGMSHHSSVDTCVLSDDPALRVQPHERPKGTPCPLPVLPERASARRCETRALSAYRGGMSGSLPFGFGMPDEGGGQSGFDMSQLGAMLQHLGRLLESGGDGAVNWDLARDTARQAIAQAGDPRSAMRTAAR